MPFFPLTPLFTTFFLGHAEKSKFRFWTRKWPTSLGFSFFFLRLSFFSFSYLSAAVIDLLLCLLPGKFYHGVATCSCRQFFSEFVSQTSQHFRVYFRLHWADHSVLGIIGKIFPPAELEYRRCQFWSKVMTSEEKQRPTLVTVVNCRHRSQWVN